jgi:hypothetical protein
LNSDQTKVAKVLEMLDRRDRHLKSERRKKRRQLVKNLLIALCVLIIIAGATVAVYFVVTTIPDQLIFALPSEPEESVSVEP